jgi:hypothetical protein
MSNDKCFVFVSLLETAYESSIIIWLDSLLSLLFNLGRYLEIMI